MNKTKCPRAIILQAETARERANKTIIPVTADTASYHVAKLFEENAEMCEMIARQAIRMKKRGLRVSVSALFEWARIEHFNLSGNCSPFRVNNTIKAAFARELMKRYPELEGVFETRRARCDYYGSVR